ncbi:MAG: hypothetical protein HQK77_13530 [Desulfobacterales bacterium]|nr:hypothetical protein [Desulfobacterales bacterium]
MTVNPVPPGIGLSVAGQDGTPIIEENAPFGLWIALDPRKKEGVEVDYFLCGEFPNAGLKCLTQDNGAWIWKQGLHAGLQFPLVSIPASLILQESQWPRGAYHFYFGVDTNPNGNLDLEQLTYEMVTLQVR